MSGRTHSGLGSAAPSGTFERDSLVWSLGRLAERMIRSFLRQPGACARYARWLAEDAPWLTDTSALENGLLAAAVSLGEGGTVKLIARPSRGQFLLVIEHPRFESVVAIAHGSLSPSRQPDGVCVAFFEGDAAVAARWALGASAWLGRRSRAARDETRHGSAALN